MHTLNLRLPASSNPTSADDRAPCEVAYDQSVGNLIKELGWESRQSDAFSILKSTLSHVLNEIPDHDLAKVIHITARSLGLEDIANNGELPDPETLVYRARRILMADHIIGVAEDGSHVSSYQFSPSILPFVLYLMRYSPYGMNPYELTKCLFAVVTPFIMFEQAYKLTKREDRYALVLRDQLAFTEALEAHVEALLIENQRELAQQAADAEALTPTLPGVDEMSIHDDLPETLPEESYSHES